MGRQRGHAHRHDRSLGSREWPDRRQELFRPRPIDDTQNGLAARGQSQGPLPLVLRLLVALHQPAAHQAVDQPARRRWRASDRLGQLPNGQGAAIGQDIEAGELGEAETQPPELTGKTDDQLAPECTTHRHALADLADVGETVAGRQDRCRQVRLEASGDGSHRRRAGGWT